MSMHNVFLSFPFFVYTHTLSLSLYIYISICWCGMSRNAFFSSSSSSSNSPTQHTTTRPSSDHTRYLPRHHRRITPTTDLRTDTSTSGDLLRWRRPQLRMIMTSISGESKTDLKMEKIYTECTPRNDRSHWDRQHKIKYPKI